MMLYHCDVEHGNGIAEQFLLACTENAELVLSNNVTLIANHPVRTGVGVPGELVRSDTSSRQLTVVFHCGGDASVLRNYTRYVSLEMPLTNHVKLPVISISD
jgi:hypothetical protein